MGKRGDQNGILVLLRRASDLDETIEDFKNYGNKIENFAFSDGMSLNFSQLTELIATEGDDTITMPTNLAGGTLRGWGSNDGTAAINATGDEADNVITGNTAANILSGLGGSDTVSVNNFFSTPNSTVDNVNLAGGSYLTAADLNRIIQDMAAFAVNEGIALNSIDDVRNNQQLMTLVVDSWHP